MAESSEATNASGRSVGQTKTTDGSGSHRRPDRPAIHAMAFSCLTFQLTGRRMVVWMRHWGQECCGDHRA